MYIGESGYANRDGALYYFLSGDPSSAGRSVRESDYAGCTHAGRGSLLFDSLQAIRSRESHGKFHSKIQFKDRF